MSDQIASRPALGVSHLIRQSFQLLLTHFSTLFPMAFVPALIMAALAWATTAGIPADFDPSTDILPSFGIGGVVSLLVQIVMAYFVMALLCLAALDALIGKRHTMREYGAQALRHLVPITVIAALLSLATAVGFLFFILPGLYITARYLPWVQTVVFEDAGWSGLTRARDLTENYRWPLAGAILVVFLAVAIAVFLTSWIGALLGGNAIITILLDAAFSGFYYALIAIFTALIYARLREIKEGVSIAQIAGSID
jgi:hypothetical protein